jgi:hypothetical protein
MDAEESIVEVHAAIQRAIENWGRLLIATGGTLKPEKCFYHLIDFAWTQKGGWQWEMAILFCWQFVLLFVLPALVAFCQFVWGSTFWQMNRLFFCHSFCK